MGDTNLVELSQRRRAAFRERHVGMIFQDFLLFEELDALTNAGLSALFRPRSERAGIRARAAEHLQRLGIQDGTRKVASFSGGERQRVAVARALAANPDILLADEPTASLHRSAADALSQDLVALARDAGTSLIVVSHDERLLACMDEVLTIADGRPADPADADDTDADKRTINHA
ncbi:ATP-binding cassette domain-containing protein [Vreelandella azerica]|uniref:ATP-binding cassette domain-containing protein n=1 Tax=Vreelandella azerica TaxID=2732867 RepID=UPI001C116DA7|nr:ATP-binding cassette domain-containing protein [Halomonas azerica]